MHDVAHVDPGERVLIHGAAGGVGTALLELGRLAGLEMYGTASRHNHDLVSSMGATPIDYKVDDFVERIHHLTGDGVDTVFDPIGGMRQLWRSYRTLRSRGRLVWFGVAATTRHGARVIPLSLLTHVGLKLFPDGKHAPTMPNAGKSAGRDNAWYRNTLAELLGLLASGEIAPIIAARFSLAEAAKAHELLERRGHGGKILRVA